MFEDLGRLARPQLLVKAARHAAARMTPGKTPPELRGARDSRHPVHLDRLMDMESQLNIARMTGEPGYRPSRHVMLLASMIRLAMDITAPPGPS